jgi:hypothetical protein
MAQSLASDDSDSKNHSSRGHFEECTSDEPPKVQQVCSPPELVGFDIFLGTFVQRLVYDPRKLWSTSCSFHRRAAIFYTTRVCPFPAPSTPCGNSRFVAHGTIHRQHPAHSPPAYRWRSDEILSQRRSACTKIIFCDKSSPNGRMYHRSWSHSLRMPRDLQILAPFSSPSICYMPLGTA